MPQLQDDFRDIVLCPKVAALNVMRSAYIHRFKPGIIEGRVYNIVSLSEEQHLRIAVIVGETGLDLNILNQQDVKDALMGPNTPTQSENDRWFFRDAERMRLDFGFNLSKSYWPDHFKSLAEYSPLEGMTLSFLYSLRHHVPHLEPDGSLLSFWRTWRDGPKDMTYGEMVGLGYILDPKFKCNAFRLGKKHTFVDHGISQGNSADCVSETFSFTFGDLYCGLPIEIVGVGMESFRDDRELKIVS